MRAWADFYNYHCLNSFLPTISKTNPECAHCWVLEHTANMCVRSATRCLLCNQGTSSALIGTGNGKSEELSQLFEIFCDYLKLDPDRKLRKAYHGRLFPFCNACSFNVYQLFDYHKEKVRILEKLSQVVVSMAVLILESDESDSDPESSHSVGADLAAETLAGQITALRKCVVQNYSPKLRLQPVRPPEIKAVKAKTCRPTKNIKIRSKQGINNVSADVSTENILEGSLDLRSKGSKAKLFTKTETENNISDSLADFGVGEAQDDFMDYGNDGDADDLNAIESEESDDSTSESSGDDRNLRPRTKFRVTAKGSKRRARTYPVKIDENTYSFGNYKYTVNGSEFKCETCPTTAISFERMRLHLRMSHIRNLPPIPEKPMNEYKVGKNKYMLVDEYPFDKVGEKEFRCSTCKQTATTWSKMYAHIRELHFGPTRNKNVGLKGDPRPFVRPVAHVTPLGDKEFECLSFKFSVLPHGSRKCLTCGYFTFTQLRMVTHIREMHADFLPKVPDKSLEEFEIHPNLFCLSRRYMFERTGDNCFDCTFPDCNVVTPTWEEMYAHIRTDHYYPLERLSRQGQPRPKDGRKSLAPRACQDPQAQVPTEGEAGSSYVGEPATNPASDKVQADMSSSTPDLTQNKKPQEEALPEAEGRNIPKSKGEEETLLPRTQTSAQTLGLSKIRKRKRGAPTRDVEKESQGFADLEISPGRYSYKDFEFHRSEDGQFICDSCDISLGTESKHFIFTHITRAHIQNDGVKKTGPNEYLLRGTYPAIRDEAGKFRCRVEGCESRTGFANISLLKVHVNQRHFKLRDRKRPVLSMEEKRDKRRREQEETQRALSKFQVGPNQYNYKGIDFVFRDDMYHCGSCGFETRIFIVTHIRKKHVTSSVEKPKRKKPAPDERLSCEEISPNEFLFAGEFRAYRLPDGKFKCGVNGCESIMSWKCNLVAHIRLCHYMSQEMCELCGQVCKNIRILESHRALMHGEGEEQECPECGKVFRNALALRNHVNTHKAKAVPKPLHVCHSCGKAYTNAGGLRNHIKSQHSEVKPTFPCDQCGRVYSDAVSLRVHMRVEHLGGGEKTHPCPVCQKQFKYKETVRRHILVVHEGKKSSEVYKRKQKPGSSAGTSAGSRRKKRVRTEAPDTDAGSSMEGNADTADEDDSVDFQKLIDF